MMTQCVTFCVWTTLGAIASVLALSAALAVGDAVAMVDAVLDVVGVAVAAPVADSDTVCARAAAQTRDRVRCLAGDDIFFHRSAVKVLIEPASGAIVEVMRWRWREKEDWSLFLAQWPKLELLVSALGTDQVGAANFKKLAHQADLLHERVWWPEEIFT